MITGRRTPSSSNATTPARLAIQAIRSAAGTWSIETTDTATGAIVAHRQVGPQSRIGRALEQLARDTTTPKGHHR